MRDLPPTTRDGEGSSRNLSAGPSAFNSLQVPISHTIGGIEPRMPWLTPTRVVPPTLGQATFNTQVPSYDSYLAFLAATGQLPPPQMTPLIMHSSCLPSTLANPSSSQPVIYRDFANSTNFPFSAMPPPNNYNS